jgi:hypothetical protein
MTNRTTIRIEHDGATYDGQIMTIQATHLGYGNDHGIMSADLTCVYPGGGIGVGGYCLDKSTGAPDYERVGTAYGLDHLIRIIETVGANSWEKLRGQAVIVLFEEGRGGWGGRSVGIAGLTNDKVLILQAHADHWRETAETADTSDDAR